MSFKLGLNNDSKPTALKSVTWKVLSFLSCVVFVKGFDV
jgi:hypothetical protein